MAIGPPNKAELEGVGAELSLQSHALDDTGQRGYYGPLSDDFQVCICLESGGRCALKDFLLGHLVFPVPVLWPHCSRQR